jgi:hypothetical protein
MQAVLPVLNSDRPNTQTATAALPPPYDQCCPSDQSDSVGEESLVSRVRRAALLDPSICADISCDRPVPSRFE